MGEIQGIVKQYILQDLASGEEGEGITAETNLKDSGILDSLSTLKLVSFLEETFRLEVRAEDIEAGHLTSLARIENYITTRGHAPG